MLHTYLKRAKHFNAMLLMPFCHQSHEIFVSWYTFRIKKCLYILTGKNICFLSIFFFNGVCKDCIPTDNNIQICGDPVPVSPEPHIFVIKYCLPALFFYPLVIYLASSVPRYRTVHFNA